MNDKIEKIKMKAGDELKNDVEIYGAMNDEHCRMICRMREIIYEESKKVFSDPVIIAPDVKPQQRLRMVVNAMINKISKEMDIQPNSALLFLMFDKILFEVSLQENINKSLAENPAYQKILQDKKKHIAELDKEEKRIRRAKREMVKVQKRKKELGIK